MLGSESANSHVDRTGLDGTTCYYLMTASNAAGEGPASAEVPLRPSTTWTTVWDQASSSWIALTDWLGRPDGAHEGAESVALDPSDPSRVSMTTLQAVQWGNGRFYCSSDQGSSWSYVNLPFPVGANAYLYKSTDGGADWSAGSIPGAVASAFGLFVHTSRGACMAGPKCAGEASTTTSEPEAGAANGPQFGPSPGQAPATGACRTPLLPPRPAKCHEVGDRCEPPLRRNHFRSLLQVLVFQGLFARLLHEIAALSP